VNTARVVPLAGGRKFRDLGGYETLDGRRLRWGRVYRSGVLTYLTDRDAATIQRLGIRVVCDLRTRRERDREPTRWPIDDSTHLNWDYDPRHTSLRGYLTTTEPLSPDVVRNSMLNLYRNLPRLFAVPYADLFRQLGAGGTPLVFHCSAGKDRTGLAAALILHSLGVPRETILADYELTNSVVDLETELFQHPRSSIGIGEDYSHLTRTDAATRAPLLHALPEYLDAALAQVEQDHGSLDAYLHSQLGVTAEVRQRLQQQLLEA
jgi:protein-tyrosine phosphatase